LDDQAALFKRTCVNQQKMEIALQLASKLSSERSLYAKTTNWPDLFARDPVHFSILMDLQFGE